MWLNKKAQSTEDDFTSLHFAGYYDNIALVRYLVECGADAFAITSQGVDTMHIAVQGDAVRVVHYLHHDLKVDLDGKDRTGFTPLHWAAYSSSYSCLRYLLA